MQTLIDQIEASLGSGLYLLSLYATLTIPDIAGALCSENGEATGAKYKDWFEKWARPMFVKNTLESVPPHQREYIKEMKNPLTGDACYRFRCSLLHQGSSQHPKSAFNRIIFIEPGATLSVIHYGNMGGALCIDLNLFCREMISGARLWLRQAAQDPCYIKNHKQFARRHKNGLEPYIVGVPVIG
ncbi:hypothetical protein [Polaromonas glacialis]|uniref:hypothetical protein n=1 Tax=Polaromonas glacialis TaxID=866564 RepID=UPI0009FBA42B|nr:hypothetical protein [Polaromonas glacialis]